MTKLDDALSLGIKIKADTNHLLHLNTLISKGDNFKALHTILDIAITQGKTFNKEDTEVLMSILKGDEDWQKLAHSFLIGSSNTI